MTTYTVTALNIAKPITVSAPTPERAIQKVEVFLMKTLYRPVATAQEVNPFNRRIGATK